MGESANEALRRILVLYRGGGFRRFCGWLRCRDLCALDLGEARAGEIAKDRLAEAFDERLQLRFACRVAQDPPGFRGFGERRQRRGCFILALGRPEIEIGAAEIAIGGGRLRAARRGLHAVAHLAEQEPDFEPLLLQMLQERAGERAVLALAIVGDIVLARGVGDQLVAFEQGGRGQAAGDGAFRARFPGQARGERIAAAAIEDHHAQRRGAPGLGPQARERNRLVLRVLGPLKHRIHRQDIGLAADADAVPRVEDQRPVRARSRIAEALQRRIDLRLGKVVALGHLGEPCRAQRFGHGLGVAHRVRKRAHGGIGRIADHKRDPPLGPRREGYEQDRNRKYRAG